MGLDELIPEWDWRERHRITTALPAAALMRAAEELTWGEVALFRALMSARFRYGERFPAQEPVLSWFHDVGFVVLLRTDTELILGALQPARRTPKGVELAEPRAAAFRRFAEPGHLKIVVGFRARPGELTTQTRVFGTDAGARRRFAVYWVVIRAGSGLIRRQWLRAIRRRADRADKPTR